MPEIPKVLKDGSLNPKWLAGLDGNARRQWVYDLLHDRELDLVGDRESEPHYLLLDIYEDADSRAREALGETVADFVDEMAGSPEGDWQGRAGDRLLFVASEIRGNSIISPVRRMIESGRFVDPDAGVPGDIHFRLLQTLVAKGVQEGVDFWQEQAALCPEQYLAIAFDGASLSSVGEGLGLLKEFSEGWTDTMKAGIGRTLDELQDRRGAKGLAQDCRQWLTRLGSDAREAVEPFCRAEEARQAGKGCLWGPNRGRRGCR